MKYLKKWHSAAAFSLAITCALPVFAAEVTLICKKISGDAVWLDEYTVVIDTEIPSMIVNGDALRGVNSDGPYFAGVKFRGEKLQSFAVNRVSLSLGGSTARNGVFLERLSAQCVKGSNQF